MRDDETDEADGTNGGDSSGGHKGHGYENRTSKRNDWNTHGLRGGIAKRQGIEVTRQCPQNSESEYSNDRNGP